MKVTCHALQRTLIIQIAIVFSFSSGHVLCEGCRPLELLTGPGIGLDLSMNYGTAAIQYRNSTIVDIVQVNGTPAYKRAMKTMADDANAIRHGFPSMLTPISYTSSTPPYDPNYQDRVDKENILARLKHLRRRIMKSIRRCVECPKCPQELPDDPIVKELADMISSLKESVFSKHPTASEFVILSIPDFDWWPRPYRSRFTLAVAQAGLRDFGSDYGYSVSSRHALRSMGMMNCPDYFCEGKPPVLVLLYTNATLATTLMVSGNLYSPCRVRNHPDLGAESELRDEDPARYWKRAKSVIQAGLAQKCEYSDPPEHAPVGEIVVLGERGHDSGFLRVVQDIHGRAPRVLNQQEQVFAAARGAAVQARFAMVDAFDACLPNGWCAEAPEDNYQDAAMEKCEL